MAGINKVMIYGYLAQDPVHSVKNGVGQCSMTIGVSDKKDSGTEWFRVRILAERLARTVADYARKGDPLFVEGSLRQIKWTDKQGVNRFGFEIHVDKFAGGVSFMKAKSSGKEAMAPDDVDVSYAGGDSDPYGDIPF